MASPLYLAVMLLLPRGSVLTLTVALPVRAHINESTVLWRVAVPTCTAPEKKATVPVAGFPQLVPVTDADRTIGFPMATVVGNDPMEIAVGAGVMVITVEAAGPAMKLASPL